MITTNHTLNRLSLISIGGGVLIAALLFYPLYVYLPGLYVDSWQQGTAVLSILLTLLAVPTLITVGYLGAKQFAHRAKLGQTVAGAVTATLASIFFFFLLGGAAATLYGSRHLLQQGIVPAESGTAFLFHIVESVNGVIWTVYGGFWLIIVISSLCGGVGGWLAARRKKAGGYAKGIPQGVWVSFPIALSLSNAVFLVIALVMFPLLESQLIEAAQEVQLAGFVVSLPSWGAGFWPLFSGFFFYFFGTSTAVYLLYWYRHGSTTAQRKEHLIQAYGVLLVTISLPFFGIAMLPEAMWLRLLLLVNFGIGLFLVWLIIQNERTFPAKLGKWANYGEWPLWLTAVVPFLLLNINQFGLALGLGTLTLIAYFALNQRDKSVSPEEKTAASQARLATAFGTLLPTFFTFVTAQTPLLITIIGLIALVIPAIPALSPPALNNGAVAEIISLNRLISQLYRLQLLSFINLAIFGALIIGIVLLVLKLSVVWHNRRN